MRHTCGQPGKHGYSCFAQLKRLYHRVGQRATYTELETWALCPRHGPQRVAWPTPKTLAARRVATPSR